MNVENMLTSCVAVVYDICWNSFMFVTLQHRDMVMVFRCLSVLCSYAVFRNS